MGYNGVHPVSTAQVVGFGVRFPKKLLKCLFVKRLRTEVDVKEGFDYELIPVLILYVPYIGYAFQIGSLLLGVNLRLLFYASMECVYVEIVNINQLPKELGNHRIPFYGFFFYSQQFLVYGASDSQG
jgi:hypothetical protein